MRKLKLTRALKSAEDLLQDRKFREVFTLLKNIDLSQLDKGDYAYFGILFSEACLWQKNINANIDGYRLKDILRDCINFYKNYYNYKEKTNIDKYAHAKYLLGWLLTLEGNFLEARETLLESYLSHKLINNREKIPKVLNRLSYINLKTGAIDDAIDNLKKCKAICKDLNRELDVILISRNIITIYNLSGRIKRSIKEAQSIENRLLKADEDIKLRFFDEYSLALALKGDLKSAITLLCEYELINKPERDQALHHEYAGWIKILNAEFNDAVVELKKGLNIELKTASESDVISQITRLLSDAYIGLQKFDSARKTAEEALVVAEKINERSEIAGCYRVFAQVAVHNGEKEKAIEYYKKAVDIFKLIQSRYELAVTRYLMATSGLFDNGERMALLYLAREYFVSEEIEHYIEKVDRAIKKYRSIAATGAGRTPHSTGPTQTVFIATHPRIRKIVEFAENVAESNMTVFLTGPTGSGKDHLARYIHECSGRKGEFVTVNCAAIPETMIESELFGYKKGAFTGADNNRQGLFEAADGGTFYLNEIADASPVFQVKLLEVIEKKHIRRLGENKSRPVDVRIIAATNHDLEVRIKENKFRFDLYHRLNEIPITLPPLDDRKEDIAELVKHFLRQNGCNIKGGKTGLAELGRLLESRSWPGNVRELKAEIDRLCLTTKGDLEAMVENLQSDQLSDRDLLLKTLEETGWNKSETGRRLNMSEGTIRNKIKKYNLSQ